MIVVWFFTLFLVLYSNVFSQEKSGDVLTLTGPYFDQNPPGVIPEVFAPDILSTGMNEAALVFSPDLKEIYFERMHMTHRFSTIVTFNRVGGKWQEEVASFSGKQMDSSPFVSWDNKKLFYCSNRPIRIDQDRQDFDIWFVNRIEGGWSEPMHMGGLINTERVDVNPCVTRNGNLYFASNRDGGKGGHDIYMSLCIDGEYQSPVNLGNPINSSDFESSPYVAPDESYMIINVFAGRQSQRKSGLYISFKDETGVWGDPLFMGDSINMDKPSMFASVSPDGKYLFFTSQTVPYLPYVGTRLNIDGLNKMLNGPQNGSGDIYWVDSKVIEKLRPEN